MIQNIHHFRDEMLINFDKPPTDHVVIFDEAQRAWNARKTAGFLRERGIHQLIGQSESEFLISTMDRLPDWAVIVALIGGGQEIYDGEAGLNGWFTALAETFKN
ncbi:MAG: DNA/RNA helicase domain-containing protein, partial [Methylophaga sp.]|nr:DNA/RNA helicase domain-containing protein [Methylophaga sp.]